MYYGMVFDDKKKQKIIYMETIKIVQLAELIHEAHIKRHCISITPSGELSDQLKSWLSIVLTDTKINWHQVEHSLFLPEVAKNHRYLDQLINGYVEEI